MSNDLTPEQRAVWERGADLEEKYGCELASGALRGLAGVPKDSSAVRRQRILNKIAALWEANPEWSLQQVLLQHVEENFSDVQVTDGGMEVELDRALAKAGVKVSVGWRS